MFRLCSYGRFGPILTCKKGGDLPFVVNVEDARFSYKADVGVRNSQSCSSQNEFRALVAIYNQRRECSKTQLLALRCDVYVLSIKFRICRANKNVIGKPKNAPPTTDAKGVKTGKPTHDPMRDAKYRFIAAAPAPNGYKTAVICKICLLYTSPSPRD